MPHYRKVLEWDKIILVCHYIIAYFCIIQLLIEVSMEQSAVEQMRRKIQFLLFLFLCLVSIPLTAQNIEVKGIVTEATTNDPLPGVTVKVKGKDTGTITSIDGKYAVNVNKGDILVFSTVGMKSIERTITSNAPINVSLEEDNVALEQVVVIGYGTVKKSHLSGAVSSVGTKELNGAVATNVGTALQGKIAGVSVASTSGDPTYVVSALFQIMIHSMSSMVPSETSAW